MGLKSFKPHTNGRRHMTTAELERRRDAKQPAKGSATQIVDRGMVVGKDRRGPLDEILPGLRQGEAAGIPFDQAYAHALFEVRKRTGNGRRRRANALRCPGKAPGLRDGAKDFELGQSIHYCYF